MQTIFIDFETYHNTKKKYDLRNISMVEYIHHPDFFVHGMGIKIDDQETRWVTARDVKEVVSNIRWDEARVIAHNVKFDGAILAWKYGVKPLQWVDTKAMVKAALGASIPSASLKHVSEVLGLPMKGELKTNGLRELTVSQEAELAEYCRRDVDICHDIFYALIKHIPGNQWELIDWTVRAFVEPQLTIQKAKCEEVYSKICSAKNELLRKVNIDRKVLASNQQFSKLLEHEGFPVPTKLNKDKKPIPALSVQDKEFLALQQSDSERLRDLCAARIAVKQTLEETRAKKMSAIADVSPYCFDVIFSGARQTHRFSGSDGCAGNPQNFRRNSELRAAIGVPEDKKLIVADFSNIELRVLAFLSRDRELTQAIVNKEDVYCKFASIVYKKPVTKKDKKERMLGKAAVLGLGYGMGAKKFRQTVYAQTGELIDEQFAMNVVQLYRNTYRGVPMFWKLCEKVLEQLPKGNPGYFPGVQFLGLQQNGIILPSGLTIKYQNLRFNWKKFSRGWSKEWVYERYKSQKQNMDETKIYGGMVTENLCQGLAGEVCKEGIVRLMKYGYSPAGQVHDELLVVCDAEEEEKVKYLVAAAMTEPLPWWKELPLEVAVNSGDNWLEAK